MQLNCTVAVVKCSWKGPFVVLALLSSLSEACTQFWRWTLWTPHWGIMILLCSIAQLHFKVFLIGTNNILWNCGYFAMWCKLRTPHWYMRISNDLDDTPQLIYLELQWRHARINNPYLYIIRWHINAKYANLYVMQLGWSIGVCNLIRFWAVEGLKLFLAIVWTASPSMHSFVWCRPVETSGGHLIWYSSQQVAIPEYHVSQLQGLHNIWVTSVWHVWEWIESAIISKMERVSSVCLIQLWQKVLWLPKVGCSAATRAKPSVAVNPKRSGGVSIPRKYVPLAICKHFCKLTNSTRVWCCRFVGVQVLPPTAE
jgi:hypothetical protein